MDDTTQWPVQGMVVVKAAAAAAAAERKDGLKCPRCSSTNTKFCYYNNYSLTQPRYLCKACRRYWTQGGCLRNIPVGGASRKYHRTRPSSSRSTTTTSSTNPNPKIQNSSHHYNNIIINNNNNNSIGMSEYMGLSFDSRNPNTFFTNSSLPVTGNPIYDSYGFHDYKRSLGFPAEGYNGNDNNLSRNINSPIGETNLFDEIQAEPNNGGFWNGMIAGGSSW